MVPARWGKGVDSRILGSFLSALIGIFLAILFVLQLNQRLRPILFELAVSQTSNHLTAAIDRAVSEQSISYNDLISLERSSRGDIVALTSNMAQANVLRSQLLSISLDALKGLESLEFDIPLGTIFDLDLLSGRGPNVGVRVLYMGTASAEFENSFTSAGINQTYHQIIFHIKADISVLLPGRQEKTTVETMVCVAETIIVGRVPETYMQVTQ